MAQQTFSTACSMKLCHIRYGRLGRAALECVPQAEISRRWGRLTVSVRQDRKLCRGAATWAIPFRELRFRIALPMMWNWETAST